jgi:transcriptional regulator with XRE-family HTH domain
MMEARSWMQDDLAAALGVEQPHVSKWLSGRNAPDAQNLAGLLRLATEQEAARLLAAFEREPAANNGSHGETVRHTRERLGLSQARLAELLGVQQPTVSRWERGVLAPTEKQLEELLKLSAGK